jgi:glucose/arabinose dehydrogenase
LFLSVFPSYKSEATTGNNILLSKDLSLEVVFDSLEFPSSMAFLGEDDILVLEKNKGTVLRIINGTMLEKPLLDVNVATESERGLLGIAIARNVNKDTTYVFLYYTEAKEEDGGESLGNRLYRYELLEGEEDNDDNSKLINPKLLLDLPHEPGPAHNGGEVAIGPDNNVYVVVGNLYSPTLNKGGENSLAQNVEDGKDPDGRGGILRLTQDGEIVNGKGILGDEYPLNLYYAYGIRNSFGIAFDPVTGNLWDTENGPASNDEINLVEPGFNSGWVQIQGLASSSDEFNPDGLLNFDGQGQYSDPEFVWSSAAVGPTSLKFLHSDKLGKEYENDLFVGDFHLGNLYHFDLNEDRTSLILDGVLADRSLDDDDDEIEQIIFGQNFGGIIDIEVGPDGYLYLLSLYQGADNCRKSEENEEQDDHCIPYSSTIGGTIFKIHPVNNSQG